MSSSHRTRRASRSLAIVGALTLVAGAASYFVPTASAAPSSGQATFVDYAQCANGDPSVVTTICDDGWINGTLIPGNSHYHEDEVTPQRAEVVVPKGSATNNRTLTFRYQTRKGPFSTGTHAYDSLATWNYTVTSADRCQGLGTSGGTSDCVGGAPTTFPIPADPTAVPPHNGVGISDVTSAHQLPGQVMTMYGGTIDAISVPTHDNATGKNDDYATVKVTYHVAPTIQDQKVQLLFGGHLAASTGPRGWGVGKGASNISGGPYHVKWDLADGASIGNRDNQIQASAILAQAGLSVTKTPDNSPISSGDQMGFTVTVLNTTGTIANNVQLSDPLPVFAGSNWTESPDIAACTISGTAPAQQTLGCGFGSLGANQSVSVHVVSPTASTVTGTISNTATATSDNSQPAMSTATVTVNAPNLSIVKTADQTPVNAGTTIGFGVTVTNGGTGVARNATLSDPLPGGAGIDWSISPSYPGPGTCGINGSPPAETLTCSFGDLAGGASATVHVQSNTTSSTSGTFNNIATVQANNNPSRSDDAVITVNKPNLSVTKTAENSVVNAGENIAFSITVTNGGPGTANNVTLSDPLPGGTGIDWSISPANGACSITGSPPSETLSCSFGNLTTGQSASVRVQSATTASTSGTFSNTATAKADNNPEVESTAVTVTVNRAGLGVTKTADDAVVSSGDQIGFTVTVTNAGPGTALGATLDDTLPAGTGISWSINPAYSGPGTCGISGSPQLLSCSFGDLAPLASASVHVISQTTEATSGTFSNTATTRATNNPPTSTTTTVTVNAPRLTNVKSADEPTVNSGDPIGFTVTVTNHGPGVAKAVTLNDPLPGGAGIDWSISPAYPGPGTCTINGSPQSETLVCSFGDLDASASATVHVVSQTTAATSGTFSNTAVADAANHPPVPSTTVTVTVNQPHLGVTKTATNPTVEPGQSIGYTITVTNSGPGTATNVIVTDPLPSGPGLDWTLSPAVAGCSITGSPPAEALGCTFPTLAPNSPVVLQVTSPTTTASCGTYSNSATVQADNASAVTSLAASVEVHCVPHLVVSKTACPTTAVPGGELTYTINFSNDGSAAAPTATLVDTIPTDTAVTNAGGGTIGGGGSTVTWDVGPLAVGQSGSRTLKVLVNAANGSTLHNSVSLSSPGVTTATFPLDTPVSNAGAITHGSAYGADISVLGLGVHHLGEVSTVAPPSPDAEVAQLGAVNVLGVLGLDLVRQTSVSSVTTEAQSTATSTVAGLNILSGGITADVIKGVSQSVAGPGSASYNFGGSTFTNLRVNGTSLANVAPNTRVDVNLLGITVASAVLNEQIGTSSVSGGFFKASSTINMIHVKLLDRLPLLGLPKGAEIIIGHAVTDAMYPSGLACGTSAGSVSGEAFTAFAQGSLAGVPVVTAKQGDAVLPPTGGSDSDQIDNLLLPGLLFETTANNTTSGSLVPTPNSTARARVAGANVLGGLVTADVLDVASTSSTSPVPATTFATTFTNVRVGGVLITVAITPNTTIALPQPDGSLLLVILNEQVTSSSATGTEGTVNAVHAFVLRGGLIELEVIVASAHSDAHLHL